MTSIVLRSVVGAFLVSSFLSVVIAAQNTHEAQHERVHSDANVALASEVIVGRADDSHAREVAAVHVLASNAVGEANHSALLDTWLAAPINDAYGSPITAFRGRTRFTMHLATRGSEGQEATTCWSEGGVDQDVWFKFQADETGLWTVSTCATVAKFDSRIVVYEFDGEAVPTTEVACDDNACTDGEPGGHASASFYAELGQVLLIQIGAVGSPGTADAYADITVD